MKHDLDDYWEAVQRKVCQKCIDGDGHGNCRLGTVDECALKVYLPQIVEVVLAARSPDIEPYVQELRQKVCGECRHQGSDGNCLLRNAVDCALDRYFPLVVDAIEELHSKRGGNPKAFGD
jgi:hypothetical protein